MKYFYSFFVAVLLFTAFSAACQERKVKVSPELAKQELKMRGIS